MNVRIRRIVAVILGICFLTGCESKENKEQFVQPQGLEALRISSIVPVQPPLKEETVLPEDEVEPEDFSMLMEAEVTGAEEETLRSLIRAAEVYNSPSAERMQIGTLRRGERVSAIGPAETADWYMIEYNGRVAYIETEVLEEQAGNTGEPTAAPTSTPTSPPVQTPEPAAASTPPLTPSPVQTSGSPDESGSVSGG